MRYLLPALAAAALVVPAGAAAAPRPPDLWATINVCDSQAKPDRLGVRARMPGNGTRQQMYMRFRAQFFAGGRWQDVGPSARSRWIRLGSARVRHRETGFTFAFDPPSAGSRFVVRGVVDYQWRERRRSRRTGRVRTVVVRRVRANTKGGFESTAGADPPGYSAGVCEIR